MTDILPYAELQERGVRGLSPSLTHLTKTGGYLELYKRDKYKWFLDCFKGI